MPLSIAIGGDHAGFALKSHLIAYLQAKDYEVTDFGPTNEESVDYPDFAHPLSEAISNKEYDFGILICGSGMGVSISANRHANVRAALCWMPDLAELTRQHNNANVLCLAGRFTAPHLAEKITDTFLNTPFEGGRHDRRVSKIEC